VIIRFTALSFLCMTFSVNCAAACSDITLSKQIDQDVLWNDISVLANTQMQGRETATSGGKLAAQYIRQRYQNIGLKTFPLIENYLQHFSFSKGWSEIVGANVLGWIEGNKKSDKFIIVSAHYDHLGHRGGKTFNGADDNASGVAALLSIAQYIADNGSHYSIVFVATDAEEKGLHGAKAFLSDPPVAIKSISYNLNLDMLGGGGRHKRLYVTPSKGHSGLQSVIQSVIDTAGLCLVKGHRSSRKNSTNRGHINWRLASDHAAFGKKNIPYLYVGVGDHSRYHTVNDTTANIDRLFFNAASQTALSLLLGLDSLIEANN
jgi:Zn-dependent M28 family amino/carboxypeptidase